MVALPLGKTPYRRRGARTPEVEITNLLVEQDPTNQVDGVVHFQRPALTAFATVGTGPSRGIFRRAGVLLSQYITVTGSQAYLLSSSGTSTLLGSIPGADIVTIDGSATRAIIVASGTAYSTDGVTLTAVVMPNGEAVSSVVWLGGYFILTCSQSQRFYWLAPGDVDPDPLSFASAEAAPDNIVGAVRLLDEVWMFGEQTTEVFQLTGDIDAPFQPVGGRMYEKGCANKDTITVIDNTLFWVGNDQVAYRANSTPIRISDHTIEEKITDAGSMALRAWSFSIEGHTIYCLRIGSVGTYCHDVENQSWPRFKSYGYETWRAHVGAQIDGSLVIAGDDQNGTLWRLDNEASNDNGEPMERVITGGLSSVGAPTVCKNISLNIAVGWAQITGSATDPIIAMQFSDDGGNLWSAWLEVNFGLQGKYRTNVAWQQLGVISPPGRLFRFRVTDDALLRISYARMNDYVAATL